MTLVCGSGANAALELKSDPGANVEIRDGASRVAVPREIFRSHLLHGLAIDTWYFDSENEANKFKIFPNDFKLTVPNSVERRFANQLKSLSGTLEFFGSQPRRFTTLAAYVILKAEATKLKSAAARPSSILVANRAIEALIDEMLRVGSSLRFSNAPSMISSIAKSYLPAADAAADFKFQPFLEGGSKGPEMMSTGVTQLQWFQVMGTNPSFFAKRDYCPTEFREIRGVPLCSSWPVETLPLEAIRDFIRKLNWANKNYVHRLPTLAERIAALRAKSDVDSQSLRETAWYGENSGLHPHPVGTKKPSGSGIYDLRGNLWEVTHDTETRRGKQVIAGGSWFDRPTALEIGYSMEIDATWTCYDVGFRLLRTAVK